MANYARFRREIFDGSKEDDGMEARLSQLERRRWSVVGVTSGTRNRMFVLLRKEPTYFAPAIIDEWWLSAGDWAHFIEKISRVMIEIESAVIDDAGREAMLTMLDPETGNALQQPLSAPDPHASPADYVKATLTRWTEAVAFKLENRDVPRVIF